MARQSDAGGDGRDTRSELLRVALEIIEAEGLESLSIRQVAKRLGISHQAPYKHFEDRNHLIAEVVGGCFEEFGAWLRAAGAAESDPSLALRAMGQAYLGYAMTHPGKYRIMFSNPLPPSLRHRSMVGRASTAYDALRSALLDLYRQQRRAAPDVEAEADALQIWIVMHGLATLLRHDSLSVLGLDRALVAAAPGLAFDRIRTFLQPPPAGPNPAPGDERPC